MQIERINVNTSYKIITQFGELNNNQAVQIKLHQDVKPLLPA